MADSSKSQRQIFSEALEKQTAEERMSYLDEACGSDSNLRSRLEALLQAHEEAGDFIESPALQADMTVDGSPSSEVIGTTIDRYRLLERIGEGGMAVVYRARQEQPIQRDVALKIIKLGMDTEQVIARFEAERQALALMNHPNIAKVFDAGATETGRPYFVMELVEGISFTEYCDQNRLNTRQRLELFVEACRAVKHAHDKGIIHRDIKPSNILIAQHDGKPMPKVIDFGIAKATNLRLTERTLYTREAQILGTPEYMSPEQATFGDSAIDARTDVYSLGVLLYQLLTGSNPYRDTQLHDASYTEICRIIRETEPLRPSIRLMQQAAQEKSEIDRDLDWIVMQAMEKDPEHRYQTVEDLAVDVESHLNDLPITAGPPSRWYRLRKFARRHHTPVAAGLVVAAALLMTATAATLTVFSLRPTGTDEHAAGMVQRHLWDVSANVSLDGTLSLDGRYLSCVDWRAGNLGLRDLSDKSTRLLTSNTDWDTLEGWTESSAISGEGQWIAYSWYLEADRFYELRVIGRTGNDTRVLYHDPNTYWIKPYAWSPDGQAVLAYFSDREEDLIDGRTQERYRRGRLVLVNVRDGSVRVLQSWDTLAYPKTAVFSPDGSRVAYDLEQDENAHQAGHGDIFVYDLKTGQSSRRVSHPADDRLLGWTPQDDRLLFQSNRNASMGLWLIGLDDASDESTPILLKQDFAGRPVGLTRNGSFYYEVSTTSNDVYLAQVDESGLNFVKKPQIISSRFVGSASMGVWSPDGKVLAYRVGRSGKRYSYRGPGDWVFSLYSLETGQERLLEPDPPFRAGFRLRGPQFSADGNSLLVYGAYLAQGPGLYQIDCQTGRTTLLRIPADEGLAWGPWSADGRVLYFRRSESLIQYDPTTQEEKTLYQGPWNLSGMAISTDGQRLACWRGPSSLVILPAAGGSPREVLRLTDDEQSGPHTFVTWMPDNQHLLFPKKGRELWRLNSQTGRQQQIGGPLEHLCHVDVHPDGRQLAFTLEQTGSELWVMEGFLPE